METQLISILVTVVLSGGLASVVTIIVQGRQTARKIKAETASLSAKLPAEVDSIAIQGAESAVTMLQITNQSLVEENTRLRSHIDRLEIMVAGYRQRLEAAESALHMARQEYAALESEIQSFRQNTPPRQ